MARTTALGIVLLFLVGCWVALQFGGWWKTLGGVLVVVPTGVWLAEFVFGKIEAERWKNAAATFLQRTLRQPRFLSAGWAMFAVAALGYSTLIVAPGSGDGKVRVTVGSAGGGSTKQAEIGGDEVLRRPVFFPLGRSFTVRASGYVPADVRVFPVLPRQIRLGEDIRPLPSVLLRPPSRALLSLVMGGKYVIVAAGTDQIMAEGKGTGAHALLVGGGGTPSESQTMSWDGQLPTEAKEREAVLQAWSHPVHVDLEFRPGMQLEARIHDPNGSATASARFDVPTEFHDVLMQEVAPP